jgi:hypothetical protein
VVLRRPPASYRLFVYVTGRHRRFTLRLAGIDVIFVYVTRRRSRLHRFGRDRRDFIYVTFLVRFAPRADPANRVGRPPVLDAVIVRQEAPSRGEGQLGVVFADEAGGQVNQQLRQPGAGPEQGASQALDIDRHVNGVTGTESAAAEPAVEPVAEFQDELGGVKAVGGGPGAGQAGEAYRLSAGPVFGINQGQFVDAPFTLKAVPAFAPVELVAIQFPMIVDGVGLALAQDHRPLGQQIGETCLQRSPCRDGHEAPAVVFDRTGGRERGVRSPNRKPAITGL